MHPWRTSGAFKHAMLAVRHTGHAHRAHLRGAALRLEAQDAAKEDGTVASGDAAAHAARRPCGRERAAELVPRSRGLPPCLVAQHKLVVQADEECVALRPPRHGGRRRREALRAEHEDAVLVPHCVPARRCAWACMACCDCSIWLSSLQPLTSGHAVLNLALDAFWITGQLRVWCRKVATSCYLSEGCGTAQ
jgi:hypothetical protein